MDLSKYTHNILHISWQHLKENTFSNGEKNGQLIVKAHW